MEVDETWIVLRIFAFCGIVSIIGTPPWRKRRLLFDPWIKKGPPWERTLTRS